MTRLATVFIFSLVTAACGGGGGDDGGGGIDAPIAAQTITITGTASEVGISGSTPVEGVVVAAFANNAETTPVAMATTDAAGNYSLVISTNGVALDGFVKATKAGLVDTYLYPPTVLTADFAGASINMVAPSTFDLVSTVCQGQQDAANGTIAVLVRDAATMPVGAAMISSTPSATKYCYNNPNGQPDGAQTETQPDGIGFMFNVTGQVSVTATKSGTTFKSHTVNARAGALTTTLVEP